MYVMDQLNDAERQEVESLAAQHPEIRKEIMEVEQALGAYNELQGLTPPDYVLDNILEATAKMPAAVAESTPTSISPMAKRSISLLWPMAAAVVGLALATWMYFGKQDAQQKLASLQKESTLLRNNAQNNDERLRLLQAELNELKAVCCAEKVVVKAGQEAIAAVYWNPKGQLAHLKLENLPNPGKDKQYQLWAFVNNKPVSVGVVDWEALKKGLVSFSFQNKPELFAISLEKMGGSPVPTDVKGASPALKG